MIGPCRRPRNAAVTSGAILDAATCRFTARSYDEVGMRDIARDVGVDPALISRYFGSKEDLFSAVLDRCGEGKTLMNGDRSDFGVRLAHELVFDPKNDNKLQGLLIMLRSIGSARAMEVVQRRAMERFHQPFAEWIGGEHAAAKGRLAAGLIMGMAISREMTGGFDLSEADRKVLCERLAKTLQDIVDS